MKKIKIKINLFMKKLHNLIMNIKNINYLLFNNIFISIQNDKTPISKY